MIRTTPPPAKRGPSFEQAATAVLDRLQHALAALIASGPADIRKAADVERAFGVDHRLGWQVYRIANAKHPLAAGAHVPARVSLDRLVRVAAKRGVAESVLTEVSAAFDAFEAIVLQYAGSRAEFDALISSAIPEEHERVSLESRALLYQASRTLRGAAMRTALFSHIVYPNARSPELLDECNIMGNFGVHRIRRASVIETSAAFRDAAGSRIQTIDGRAITGTTDVTLARFCSQPTPVLVPRPGERETRFVLEGDDVGLKAAVDYVFADYLPAGRSRFATPERQLIGAAFIPDVPAQRQIVDLLVHDELVPVETQAHAAVYDIVPRGHLERVPDPDRELDRVDFTPSVRVLHQSPAELRSLHLPTYQEIVRTVCEARGWDIQRLRGYRVEIEYPAYTWQTLLTLPLPAKP